MVLTGLAIVAAAGIAGVTREQWMGQPVPAVAKQETAPPPAAPATPSQQTAAVEPPAAQQPAAEQPAAQQPATQPPPVTQPVAEQPTAEQPAPQEPAAEQAAPAATQPVAEQPAAQQPAVAQPVTEQPAAQPAQTAAVQPEATAQPEAQPAENAPAKAEVPAFDTVRVEKTGEAVIAGRAAAGSEVVIKLNGEEIGKTVSNSDGAFVVVPEKPLPAGSGAITIEATGKGDLQPMASKESVAVIVPEGQPQGALVAVVSPDAPTKVLQKPEAPAAEAQPAAPAAAEQPAVAETPAKLVSIDAVDYDPAGNIVFSGQGQKGNTARIYVDNSFLGDAPVGEDGRWTYSATANVSQGVHSLRVDGLDSQGTVVNRVEVPIFREDQTKVADATPPANAPAAEQPAAAPAAEQPAQQPAASIATTTVTETPPPAEATTSAEATTTVTVQEPAKTAEAAPASTADATAPAAAQETTQQAQETVAATAPEAASPAVPKDGRIVIQPGNNLWRISRVLYGTGNKFTMLYEANKDQIRNPNLIYPGQVFRTPDVTLQAPTIDPRRREPLAAGENAGAAQ